MRRLETQRQKTYFVRLILAQLIVTFLGMLFALLIAPPADVLSVLKGALVALLPHAFFIYRMGVFRVKRRTSGAMDLFRAEAGKFGLTVALFSLVFVVAPPSNPAFFFSAYVAIVLTHWLAPWLMPRKSHNLLR
ncbi:ATP synthase subunit I [Halomonas qinghailakensis]|uniref:ATP synthase subunit I n=2 Tax=Halomonas TaxID=2745 RepID=A0AA46TTV1_9GAMM|nr:MULTISPECIES: ATP synthase subunit I [Halomonas]UYO76034.1 ATP synthase subunit I [Halomonas sp. ZZQ-149]UYV19091.1 ATP synthase subunit I [Halomonas qaidamensis]